MSNRSLILVLIVIVLSHASCDRTPPAGRSAAISPYDDEPPPHLEAFPQAALCKRLGGCDFSACTLSAYGVLCHYAARGVRTSVVEVMVGNDGQLRYIGLLLNKSPAPPDKSRLWQAAFEAFSSAAPPELAEASWSCATEACGQWSSSGRTLLIEKSSIWGSLCEQRLRD